MSQLTIHHPSFGAFCLRAQGGAIVGLDFGAGSTARLAAEPVREPADEPADELADGVLARAAAGLMRYFATGDLPTELKLAPAGTAYQQRVWACLRTIPRGETRTYGEVARAVGGSPRAVGGANRANPIAILIPCHRVRGASGLGGYCGSCEEGWGLAMKRRLLALEGALESIGEVDRYMTGNRQSAADGAVRRA